MVNSMDKSYTEQGTNCDEALSFMDTHNHTLNTRSECALTLNGRSECALTLNGRSECALTLNARSECALALNGRGKMAPGQPYLPLATTRVHTLARTPARHGGSGSIVFDLVR